jgi:hypothetical protein
MQWGEVRVSALRELTKTDNTLVFLFLFGKCWAHFVFVQFWVCVDW